MARPPARPHAPLKGRGALSNPPDRFSRTQTERTEDGWYVEPEPPKLETTVEPDRARTVISHNDSPDVGFEQSINPYRGCEHGCSYCLEGETPILMGDGTTRPIASLRVGDEIYGTVHRDRYRYYQKTRVLAHWSVVKPAYRISLRDGTQIIAGADHRFLTERGWKFVTGAVSSSDMRRPHLTTNDELLGTGAFADAVLHDELYERGYPAIRRKLNIEGQALECDAKLRVASIEPLGGAMRLYDITTGTEDFIANGVVSHNCYARPSHAYMGLSSGLDFETRLFYKENAAARLTEELARPGYVCKPIAMGTNTDPYQPLEKRLQVTRSILEVLLRVHHPVTLVTKSTLILRDLDLLAELAREQLVGVSISVTSLDPELKRTLEPRTASPRARLTTIERLNAAGVPVGVLVAPVIPAINDHEIEAIVAAVAAAGARAAGYVLLRLPYEVKDLFREWLAQHHPLRAQHVMALIQDLRGGRDNDPRFGTRMRGTGPYAQLLARRFALACRRSGIDGARRTPLDTTRFRPPQLPGSQLGLFGDRA